MPDSSPKCDHYGPIPEGYSESPWLIDDGWISPSSEPFIAITDPSGVLVAQIFTEEITPDAHLISAAPDLYEACKAIFSELERRDPGGITLFTYRKKCLEAIARAEGRDA